MSGTHLEYSQRCQTQMTGSSQGKPNSVAYVARLLRGVREGQVSVARARAHLEWSAKGGVRVVAGDDRAAHPAADAGPLRADPLLSSPAELDAHQRLSSEPDLGGRGGQRVVRISEIRTGARALARAWGGNARGRRGG